MAGALPPVLGEQLRAAGCVAARDEDEAEKARTPEAMSSGASELRRKEESQVQKITPFLWFNDNAEEAMNFYVSIFKNSKVGRVTRYGDAGPGPKGTVMWCTFTLEGQEFYALNGGPQFTFTPAISLFV